MSQKRNKKRGKEKIEVRKYYNAKKQKQFIHFYPKITDTILNGEIKQVEN